MKKNITIFQEVPLAIGNGLIQCGGYTCTISAITQIYMEKHSDNWFGGEKDINEGLVLELSSGSRYVFLTEQVEFLKETYDFFCEVLSGAYHKENYIVDFKKQLILNQQRPPETIPDIPDNVRESPLDGTLLGEIKHLIFHFKEKEPTSPEVLSLLLDIEKKLNSGNQELLRDLYHKFISFSLINTCNKLGLNLLIEEITSKIFRE